MSLSPSVRASLVASLMAASSASAGIWGVPTNLNANGTTSGTTANPPGWFTLERQNSPTQDGDTVHQIRFFIEVTGTTLDIKVFDPGTGPASAPATNGARDLNGSAPPNTRYTLYAPNGAIYNPGAGTAEGGPKNTASDVTTAGTDAITENRLVRFSCTSGGAPTWTLANAGAAFGSGAGSCATALAPGVWIFEATVTTTADNLAVNAFGVSITDAAGAAYNVYTTGLSDNADAVSANETAFLVGTLNGTAPTAAIAMPMVLYPYVNRGCSMGTSNFDDDLNTAAGDGSSGSITDPLGTTTTLTMSNNDTSANNTITVEPTTGFNLTANNYGLFTVQHFPDDVATAQNFIDWRFADWRGFTSNGNSDSGAGFLLPPNPVDPLRVYIPNSYSACSFAAGCTMGAPPAEPYLTSFAVVVSGPNPPTAGSTTSYLVSASIYNPTGSVLGDVFAVLPILSTPVANITNSFVAGTDACFVDGVAATCTFSSGTDAGGAGAADDVTFRRAQLTAPATLAAGGTFTYQYQVNVALAAAFGGGTIPVTPAPAPLGARAPASNCADAPANVNRTINACYTPAFSSVTFDRVETLGPVCDLRTNTTTAALTAARIRAFSVSAEGLAFSVVSQRRTAAFRLFSLDGNQRTLKGSIKALVPDSAAPMIYSLPSLGGGLAPRGLFEIEEVETGGALRRYGPFSSSDDSAVAQVARLRHKLQAAGALAVPSGDGEVLMMPTARSASLVRSFQGPARSARLRSQRGARLTMPRSTALDGLRIGVTGGGPVRVSRQDLLAAGLPDWVRTGRLRLWNLGAPVAASVVEPGSPDETLVFDATELSTTYSSVNSYVVTWGGLPRPPAPSVTFSSEAAPRPRHTERVEKNVIYLASAPQGSDPWLWDYLSPGTWPLPFDPGAGTFDLPGLVPGAEDVRVTIHLVGGSPNQHTVSALINGVPAGEVTFTGRGPGVLQGNVPASTLLASGNSLVLNYAANTTPGDDFAAVFLDAVDLGVTVERTAAVVSEIVAYDAQFPTRPADYLVVTHSAFTAQAQEIVSLKNAQGFHARAVDLARIYDRFSGGVPEAGAIQKALRSVPGLRYALLVGDDTIDYHNYYELEPFPVLPSLSDWETESGRVPSENRYADFDDDGAPEIAIGRLPVQTTEEAVTAVAKIRRQGQVMAESRGKYLFVTDNQGPNDPSYRAYADAVATGLPRVASVAFADASLGVQAARDAMFAALSSGAAFTSYFGHGSPDAWADEGILSSDSVSSLAGLKETLVLMWACQSQYSTYFYGPSLGEALFLLPQGGAVASVGPAGISSTEHQVPFYEAFYREVAAGKTIGDALRIAKRQVAPGFPAGSGLVGFNLIGDPSLRP